MTEESALQLLLESAVGFQSDVTSIRHAAQQEAQHRALQTTMQSVNDIVREFVNRMQPMRRYLETQGEIEMLRAHDRAVCDTLDRLQVLSTVAAYREREDAGGLVMVDTAA